MTTTYSPSLKLALIGSGEQAGVWGTTTNTNLGTLLEQAITGVRSITMFNADYTLTSLNGTADESRNPVIVVSGTNSAIRQVIAPLVNKQYIVSNQTAGGYAITFGGSSGALITIPNGVTTQVYCDGSNFFTSISGTPGNFTVAGNLITGALAGTTATFSGAISSVSPSFTGTPIAPTAAPGTNTTQIATTAFVLANGIPSGTIVLWSGSIASIPSGWYLCNGSNGTPDLRDRFIIGAGSTYAVGATGGSTDAIVVSHTHTATSSVTDPGHFHNFNANALEHTGGSYGTGNNGNAWEQFPNTLTATTGITVATTNASAGTSGTNANLPPYYALAYIMKT